MTCNSDPCGRQAFLKTEAKRFRVLQDSLSSERKTCRVINLIYEHCHSRGVKGEA
jgi:hypothetical protein